MKFLQDTWYMAGWDQEVSRQPLLRKIAGHPVVLYRKENGDVVALSDTCPHRFAPLHSGTVIDDAIQCPYHGLRFGGSGACVFNPHGNGAIPRAARVASYPVVERDTIVWLWLGDPEKCDPAKIVDFSILNEPDRFSYTAGGTLRMDTRYDLIIDNLMDLSHAAFLHTKNLGSEALARGIISVKTEGTTVYSNRMGPNGLPSPMMVMTGACNADEYVDFWADMRWTPPANFFLETGIVPTGQPRDGNAKLMPSVQILTPESETATMYFIKLFWNFNRNADMADTILQAVLNAFREEDEWMVRQVDERMDGREFWSLKPILLQGDGGAVQARRLLERLVQQQEQQSAAA